MSKNILSQQLGAFNAHTKSPGFVIGIVQWKCNRRLKTGLKKGHAVDFEASEIPTDFPPFFRFPKASKKFWLSGIVFGKKKDKQKQTNCSIYFC